MNTAKSYILLLLVAALILLIAGMAFAFLGQTAKGAAGIIAAIVFCALAYISYKDTKL